MPLCQGCCASYDDNYKFCPHCGRAKPEPEAINLNVRVAPVRYEEAVLKIEVVETTELTEPPFDWRPSGMTKLMGEAGKNWTHITGFHLLLDCIHPLRGQYVAYQSTEFRGYVVQLGNSLKFPQRFDNNKSFQSWAEAVFLERRKAWDATNNYLIQEGWTGLSENETKRKVPSELEDISGISLPALWTYANRLEVWMMPNPPVGATKELADYRYRRVAS
jgi:hypothetical protein